MVINDWSAQQKQIQTKDTVAVSPSGMREKASSCIISEHELVIRINDTVSFTLTCTPPHYAELVVGRLVTEGLIADCGEIERIDICGDGSEAKVYLTRTGPFPEGLGLAADRLCPLAGAKYDEQWIFAMAQSFAADSKLHKRTGAAHSCYLFYKGSVDCVYEDIGRHNALDKAVGHAVLKGYDSSGCILFTTGRVPVDMARKAVMAKIPILVSKSVPTAEAAEFAKKYNLTLICKAWPDRYELFNEAVLQEGRTEK